MKKLQRLALLAAPAFLLVLVGAGCGAISSPQGWAAPVVNDAGILTSLHKGKLELYDRDGKTLKWEFPSANDKQVKLSGIYGTPQVAGDKVVFGDYNGKVYALTLADGKQLWPKPADTGASIVGSVVVDDKNAYVGNSDGLLFAIDLTSGNKKLLFKAGDRIWSAPVVDNGVVYITSMDKKAYAIDAATGSQKWANASADGAIASTPTLSDRRIFFGAFDKHLYAVNSSDGARIWQSQQPADNWFWALPLVQSGLVYSGSLDGAVYAVDAADGSPRWRQKLGTSIRSRPALVGSILVAADRDGRVQGFDATTGAPKWDKPVELESHVLSDLIVSDSAVLIATNGGKRGTQLVSIDPATGAVTDLAPTK